MKIKMPKIPKKTAIVIITTLVCLFLSWRYFFQETPVPPDDSAVSKLADKVDANLEKEVEKLRKNLDESNERIKKYEESIARAKEKVGTVIKAGKEAGKKPVDRSGMSRDDIIRELNHRHRPIR